MATATRSSPLAGDHDERHGGVALAQPVHQRLALDVFQLQIQQHQVGRLAFEPSHRRGPRLGFRHTIAFLLEPFGDQQEHAGVIVHRQDRRA